MPEKPPSIQAAKGIRRIIYICLGNVFVGLAILGLFLPILPTTPFLLLASYFFIRSSPYLNERLLRSRLFGGLIRDWQEKRGVRRSVKFTALTIIPIVITASVFVGQLSWPLVVLLVALGLVGIIVVIRLPVVTDQTDQDESKVGEIE